MRRSLNVGCALAVLGILVASPVWTQNIQLGAGSAQSAAQHQHVELVTDFIHVKAGQPDWVELHFRVDPGLHINSHTPKDELLVPTSFAVTGESQLKVIGEEYPAGIPLRLNVGAGEVLSTYQGEFQVRLKIAAAKSDSTLTGVLRYQACDDRSCFPPRNLPVRVTVVAH